MPRGFDRPPAGTVAKLYLEFLDTLADHQREADSTLDSYFGQAVSDAISRIENGLKQGQEFEKRWEETISRINGKLEILGTIKRDYLMHLPIAQTAFMYSIDGRLANIITCLLLPRLDRDPSRHPDMDKDVTPGEEKLLDRFYALLPHLKFRRRKGRPPRELDELPPGTDDLLRRAQESGQATSEFIRQVGEACYMDPRTIKRRLAEEAVAPGQRRKEQEEKDRRSLASLLNLYRNIFD